MLRSQFTICDRYSEKNVRGANETRGEGTLCANETRDFVAFAVQVACGARMKHEGASETRRALPGLAKQLGKGKTSWFHAAD